MAKYGRDVRSGWALRIGRRFRDPGADGMTSGPGAGHSRRISIARLPRKPWWLASAAIVLAAGIAVAAFALTSSGPAKPLALSTHSFTNPSGGLLRLDARIAAMLDTGKAPGATAVDLAGVNCGPPSARLRTGMDVECGLTASVGSAIMIVKIEAPSARRFAIVAIGSALGPLPGAAGAAQAACHVGARDLCAPIAPASDYPPKAIGGGTVPGPGVPGVMPCLGGPRERPSEIVFACADFNSLVDELTWSTWTAHGARGLGRLVENDCTPTCVTGKTFSYPITIELGQPIATHYGLLFTAYKVVARSPIRPTKSHTLTGTFATTPG
ncbi:MAG: hypothetical protein ABSB55_02510 [Acidimicrobiales bacterium]